MRVEFQKRKKPIEKKQDINSFCNASSAAVKFPFLYLIHSNEDIYQLR